MNLIEQIFSDWLLNMHKWVSRAEFTLVVRTEALERRAILANAVEWNFGWSNTLEPIAGANTLLIVCKDQEVAQTVQQTILQHSSH